VIKAALVLGAAAAGAAALGRGRLHGLAGRLRGQEDDPTISRLPEPRMPVTAQATVSPGTLEPGRPEEEAAEGRADARGRGHAGEALG
jgi:hypothetical protein